MSKGIDALKHTKETFDNLNIKGIPTLYQKECLDTIEKELKALDILKNKQVNIHALLLHLKRFDKPDGYNIVIGSHYQLSQQEYSLLKEVLL